MDKKYNTIIILFMLIACTIILWLAGIEMHARHVENILIEMKDLAQTDTVQIDSMVGLPFFYEDSISGCGLTDTIIYHGVKYVKMSAIKKVPEKFDTLIIIYPEKSKILKER